jgi:hypothetical protein
VAASGFEIAIGLFDQPKMVRDAPGGRAQAFRSFELATRIRQLPGEKKGGTVRLAQPGMVGRPALAT